MIPLTGLLCTAIVAFAGCKGNDESPRPTLRLGTTTTIRDSGLLDKVLPEFERATGISVTVIASGTGKTLALGRAGEVEVIWVHDPVAEAVFMEQGHGTRRATVMWNSFVLLGSQSDPAEVQGLECTEALKNIAQRQAKFCSRGDKSGTCQRELQLWDKAGVVPEWNNYLETGQGAGPTLWIADELQAYTLSDWGTYLSFLDRISLEPFAKDEPDLVNRYSVILIDPAKQPQIHAELAERFFEFLIGPDAQATIGSYRMGDQVLFHPADTLPQ